MDLADPVTRGQLVVELDDREYVQAVAQADADSAVARATLAEDNSTLDIAQRELARVETLREQGIASESQFDAAKTEQLAGQARLGSGPGPNAAGGILTGVRENTDSPIPR